MKQILKINTDYGIIMNKNEPPNGGSSLEIMLIIICQGLDEQADIIALPV